MKHETETYLDLPLTAGPIGLFDSGYGGLTILSEIKKLMPEYDYLYLGDNSRAPYGSRSFEVIYQFTLQAVKSLFAKGCNLVILACNTASAKALRSIQQKNLPRLAPNRRVLGIIHPTVEVLNNITKTNHVGILGTEGTIRSRAYNIEIAKLYPNIKVSGTACPMWASLVENGQAGSDGADFFVRENINELFHKDADIDAVILGCTHYPLLLPKIEKYMPEGVNIISQGGYVASSLKDYLHRHPEMEQACTRGGTIRYLTTESPERFRDNPFIAKEKRISVEKIRLD